MTLSMLKFEVAVAIVLAMASASVVAHEKDQTSEVNIQAGQVQKTVVGRSYTGIPIEDLKVERPVSYADLDLTTTSGAAELKRRVTRTAKEACEQLDAADPIDMSDMDDFTCIKNATEDALKQANAAITASQSNHATRSAG